MLKNEEGRVLIIVIIMMAILLILGPAIVLSSNTEVKHTTKYENNTQAFLYARSGVDAALDWLVDGASLRDAFVDENSYDGFAYMSGNLDGMDVYYDDQADDKDIKVTITYTGVGITISSTGEFNGEIKTVEVTLLLTVVGGTDVLMPAIDKALFVIGEGTADNPSLETKGGPKVIGSFGANTTGEDSLSFQNTQTIIGDMYLHADPPEDVIDSGGDPNIGDINGGQPLVVYPPADFPDPIPTYDASPSDLDVSGNFYTLDLNDNVEYGTININIKKTMTIDLDGVSREIVCDTFNFNKGAINLQGTGVDNDATLTIYVRNELIVGSSTTLNTGAEGGDITDVVIFYAGTEIPDISNTSLINASLVTDTSGYFIKGNGGIQGHLIIGGDSVEVGGTADLITRVIYAPSAHVIINGTGYVNGSIIANTAVLTGTSDIEYDPSDITSLPGGILPGVGEPIQGLGSDATQIVTSYYWQ